MLQPPGSVVLDLGYGRIPITTAEWFQRLRQRYPHVRVIGVERDPARVTAAEPMAQEGLCFRLGNFQLPLEPGEGVRLVRAMNVLRQYEEADAVQAHTQIIAQMEPGGLLAEGTCDPTGRTLVVSLLRRYQGEIKSEGILFATSFNQPFEPRAFQAVLPKHLIHRVVKGHPIYDFFEAWERSATMSRGHAQFGNRQHFVAAAEDLATRVSGLVIRRPWLRNGWLLWTGAPYP